MVDNVKNLSDVQAPRRYSKLGNELISWRVEYRVDRMFF